MCQNTDSEVMALMLRQLTQEYASELSITACACTVVYAIGQVNGAGPFLPLPTSTIDPSNHFHET